MIIIIRLSSELVLKSTPVRRRFQAKLKGNIQTLLTKHSISYVLEDKWNRFYLHLHNPSLVQECLELLSRIFGIHSLSPIEHSCASQLQEILHEGYHFYKDLLADERFAIKCQRSGSHEFSSVDVNVALGSLLNQHQEVSKVDLTHPQTTIHVDVKKEKTFFYRKVVPGAKGFPIGVQERALCLLSGGFDSVVSAWMLQKRGVEVDYVFFSIASEAYERAVIRAAKNLSDRWGHGYASKLYIVDFKPIVAALKSSVDPRFVQIILKRLFCRTAEHLAESIHAVALVTGEALGQVSSQTLVNLRAIEDAVSIPILRPLLTYEKLDIIEVSRQIGSYEFSAHLQEYCQLVPDRPSTACSVMMAREQEARCDYSVLIETALNSRQRLVLEQISLSSWLSPYIFVQTINEGSVVIDCRSEDDYKEWHYPKAVHKDFYELQKTYTQLDKQATYVLYCSHGTQSAILAELMQNHGFEAYSLQGGLRPGFLHHTS